MIEENIRNFNRQLEWEPKIENENNLHRGRAVVLGMGGSHIGADLLNAYDIKMALAVHSNYGLPFWVSKENLIIASSYSGNTEEVLDGLNQALSGGFKTAVITSGGKLLEAAKEKSLPFVQLPGGLQARMSAGYQVKALAKLLDREDLLEEINDLAGKFNSSESEAKGKELAEKIGNKIPVIYSSEFNKALSYTWKIRFNETAKVPAFYNIFPEMNHNEINGFTPGQNFHFILLSDSEDHPQIKKRLEIFSKLYTEKGFSVEKINLTGEGRFNRLFSNLILADWASYYLAKQNGSDPEQIPLVEEFKKLI